MTYTGEGYDLAEDEGWASVKDGKWHRTLSTQPTFMHDETSVCGITFRPLNVAWSRPAVMSRTSPRYICKRCHP